MISEIVGLSSSVLFLGASGAFVFLLVAPGRRGYLSHKLVRRFVEYFGDVDMDSPVERRRERS